MFYLLNLFFFYSIFSISNHSYRFYNGLFFQLFNKQRSSLFFHILLLSKKFSFTYNFKKKTQQRETIFYVTFVFVIEIFENIVKTPFENIKPEFQKFIY